MKSIFTFILLFSFNAFSQPLDINNLPQGLVVPEAGVTGKGPALADGYSMGMAGGYMEAYSAVNRRNWDGTLSYYHFPSMDLASLRQFMNDYHLSPCTGMTFGHMRYMLLNQEPVETFQFMRERARQFGCEMSFSLFLGPDYEGIFSEELINEMRRVNNERNIEQDVDDSSVEINR